MIMPKQNNKKKNSVKDDDEEHHSRAVVDILYGSRAHISEIFYRFSVGAKKTL